MSSQSSCDRLWRPCLLQAVSFFALLVFLLWLSLDPSSPNYAVVGFSVPVSNNGSNTSRVGHANDQNRTFTFDLEIKNPNRLFSVYHDDILLTFDYNQDTLGERTLPSFRQKNGSYQFTEIMDGNASVWKALLNAIAINKTAEVKANLVTSFRFRIWGRMSKRHKRNLQGGVPIGSDGKIFSKKKKIKLKRVPKKQSLKVT